MDTAHGAARIPGLQDSGGVGHRPGPWDLHGCGRTAVPPELSLSRNSRLLQLLIPASVDSISHFMIHRESAHLCVFPCLYVCVCVCMCTHICGHLHATEDAGFWQMLLTHSQDTPTPGRENQGTPMYLWEIRKHRQAQLATQPWPAIPHRPWSQGWADKRKSCEANHCVPCFYDIMILI